MNPSVKVAQPGWSTTTAPDWALVFNSDWPSLQIAFEKTVIIQIGKSLAFSVTHNLGFVPLSMAWITTTDNYGRLSSLEITSTTVSYLNSSTASKITTYTVRCYSIDITQDASYPLPTSAAAKTYPDLTTGIKIVKTNRSIGSTNLNDFILNSQAQSPAVLEIATEKGQYYNSASQSIVYPLLTSYIPWVLGAIDLSEGAGTQYTTYGPNSLTYSNNSLVLNLSVTGAGSLIVLRDPLFYPNTVRVVY